MLTYTYRDVQIKETETVLELMRKTRTYNPGSDLCKTQMNMREYIKMDTEYVGCQCVEWIHLSPSREQQQPFLNTVTSPQIP